MSAPALAAQLAEESRAAQRQYVLANTRARWTLLGLGVAPLAAVWYLGRTEAWQALALNLTGFGLATALRAAAGDWSWSLVLQESLGLAVACGILVPMLTRIVSRLRATRKALVQVERGDLT